MRRSPHHSRRQRSGFTLVELLVVMAIIAILISLLAAAVMRVRVKGPEVLIRNDLSQIANSITEFSSKRGVDFIPSYIVLREDGAYGTNPIPALAVAENQSIAYLKRLWPRLATPLQAGFAGHDWNGDGVITAGANGVYILEGDQCLVFFLGGIQDNRPVGGTGACLGFGANKSYPANVNVSGPTNSKAEPLSFDFPTDRLRVVAPSATRSQYFRSFIDQYGTAPYAYFASRGGAGGAANAYSNDCPGLGVSPYLEPNGKPVSRDGYQVISAGADLTFGPGGVWNAASGAPYATAVNGTPQEYGKDDMSNFHSMVLGNGNQ